VVSEIALVLALVGLRVVDEASVQTADCPVRIERYESERATFRLRPACGLSRASTLATVEAVRARAGDAREVSIGFGRIVEYPWLSTLLAREASSDPAWNPARGRPRKGGPNAYVARRLERSPEFVTLFDARSEVHVSVEKVLIRRAAELDLPAGAPFPASARFPFDAQLWVLLERR